VQMIAKILLETLQCCCWQAVIGDSTTLHSPGFSLVSFANAKTVHEGVPQRPWRCCIPMHGPRLHHMSSKSWQISKILQGVVVSSHDLVSKCSCLIRRCQDLMEVLIHKEWRIHVVRLTAARNQTHLIGACENLAPAETLNGVNRRWLPTASILPRVSDNLLMGLAQSSQYGNASIISLHTSVCISVPKSYQG
jgi:hypothetical protein